MDSFLEKLISQQRDKPWLSLSLIIKHIHVYLPVCVYVLMHVCNVGMGAEEGRRKCQTLCSWSYDRL